MPSILPPSSANYCPSPVGPPGEVRENQADSTCVRPGTRFAMNLAASAVPADTTTRPVPAYFIERTIRLGNASMRVRTNTTRGIVGGLVVLLAANGVPAESTGGEATLPGPLVIRSARSGDWSDPRTWEGSTAPL